MWGAGLAHVSIRNARDSCLMASRIADGGKRELKPGAKNENRGCHASRFRTVWSSWWTRKSAHRLSGFSICWLGGRPAAAGICTVRSVRPPTIERDAEGCEGYGSAFLPFRRLVTLLQSAA